MPESSLLTSLAGMSRSLLVVLYSLLSGWSEARRLPCFCQNRMGLPLLLCKYQEGFISIVWRTFILTGEVGEARQKHDEDQYGSYGLHPYCSLAWGRGHSVRLYLQHCQASIEDQIQKVYHEERFVDSKQLEDEGFHARCSNLPRSIGRVWQEEH